MLAAGGFITNALAQGSMLSPDGTSGPHHFQKSLENARQMPGILMHFMATKEQTNGAFALLEAKAVPGMEPPLHVHEHEDESFYMIDGKMIVTIGEEEYEVNSGDFIFMPRGIPHTQKILSESIHVLICISPAGFEQFFWDISQPAADLSVPPVSTKEPTKEEMEMMMKMNAKYGISPG